MVSNGSVRDKHQVPRRDRERERERKRKRKRNRKRKKKRRRERERERKTKREREREKDLNLNEPHRRLEVFAGTPRCRGPRPSGSTRTPRTSHPAGAFRVWSALPDTARSRPKSAATALTRPVWPPRREGGTPDPESCALPGRGGQGKVSSENLLEINQGTYKEGSQQQTWDWVSPDFLQAHVSSWHSIL